jgi:hypothetical protein
MTSYIWTDCNTRNTIIIAAALIVVYYYVKSQNEQFWSPAYKGKSSWYPVKNQLNSAYKERMSSGVGIYDMPYLIGGPSEYTTPYSGGRGYGQNFGPDGPPTL